MTERKRGMKKMIRAAIVEDSEKDAASLEEMLRRYERERDCRMEIRIFSRPIEFLDKYRAEYDLLFLDVDMPLCDGFSAARQIRTQDDAVIIVFVTNLANFAVKGYEVDAADYVVKPVGYRDLSATMDRIRGKLNLRKKEILTIKSNDSVLRLDAGEILFVEVYRHRLQFHMAGGGTYESWGSLQQIEKELPEGRFFRCNNCYLVNLAYVKGIKKDTVEIGEYSLSVSRQRKQQFIAALVAYVGE